MKLEIFLIRKGYICSLFHLFICLFAYLCLFCFPAFSQKDTLRIKEVEISSERFPMLYSQESRVVAVITKDDISKLPVQSLDEILKYALNVDARQRGGLGVQSDISIRGGSDEQTLILLNGVKINDPQTGHHNMNIPVDLNDIDRIEILEGPGSGILGPNAFSGAINIITASHEKNNLTEAYSVGEHNYYSALDALTYNIGKISNYISLNESGSDGYINDTDFKMQNFLYQGDYKTTGFNANLMLSYLNKSFGAWDFYSDQPPYQNEYEHTKTTFANLKTDFGETLHWTTNLYWRTNQDKFALFRDNAPSWYTAPNYSLTSVTGLDVNTYFHTLEFGVQSSTAIGAEFRRENILSNVLGDPLNDTIRYKRLSWGYYNHFKSRDIVNLNAEHFVVLNKFSLKVALLGTWSNDYNWGFSPSLDLSYQLTSSFRIFGTVNKSLRLPTFTDLYYQGPTNIGNPNLKPEEALSYEAGIKYCGKYINSHVSVFTRYGTNIIDWIKSTPDAKWQSMNFTKITTDGIEFSADLLTNKIFNSNCPINYLNLSYSYINANKSSGDFISLYTLDYLRNKFSISLNHNIIKNITASWSYSYFARASNYVAYPAEYPAGLIVQYQPYSLLDGRITYKLHKFSFYLEASNIFNKPYIDIGGIEMPGRWLKAGLIINFDF